MRRSVPITIALLFIFTLAGCDTQSNSSQTPYSPTVIPKQNPSPLINTQPPAPASVTEPYQEPVINDLQPKDSYVAPRVNPTPAPTQPAEPTTVPESGCCKICSKGKACGDSCISRSYTCHKGPGCACDAN